MPFRFRRLSRIHVKDVNTTVHGGFDARYVNDFRADKTFLADRQGKMHYTSHHMHSGIITAAPYGDGNVRGRYFANKDYCIVRFNNLPVPRAAMQAIMAEFPTATIYLGDSMWTGLDWKTLFERKPRDNALSRPRADAQAPKAKALSANRNRRHSRMQKGA